MLLNLQYQFVCNIYIVNSFLRSNVWVVVTKDSMWLSTQSWRTKLFVKTLKSKLHAGQFNSSTLKSKLHAGQFNSSRLSSQSSTRGNSIRQDSQVKCSTQAPRGGFQFVKTQVKAPRWGVFDSIQVRHMALISTLSKVVEV